ncbi:hypothetical protein DXG01_005467 [Tephrocybe rancida]|nr:hypothetical protein DXG01_005467 [Tephrocybe rancida]
MNSAVWSSTPYQYAVPQTSAQAYGPIPSLPWWSELEPPPHDRSMYGTIPLPADDREMDEDRPGLLAPMPTASQDSLQSLPSLYSASSSSLSTWTSSEPTTPLLGAAYESREPTELVLPPNQRTMALHPFLQSACASPDAQHTAPSPQVKHLAYEVAQLRDEPATTPSVGFLTLVVDPSGRTMGVHPSAPASPHIVTVGDVLDALDANSESKTQQRKTRSPRRLAERVSQVLESVNLRWKTEGGEDRPKPWRLVVGKKERRGKGSGKR